MSTHPHLKPTIHHLDAVVTGLCCYFEDRSAFIDLIKLSQIQGINIGIGDVSIRLPPQKSATSVDLLIDDAPFLRLYQLNTGNI